MPTSSSPSLTRSPLPTVAIVGRANVGKSTLWNRLVETRRALVSDEAHTTRDRNVAQATWRGRMFELVDTGGMDTEKNSIGEGIRRQAERALEEADLVVLLIDGRTGVVPEDREMARIIRKKADVAILAVNKVDHPRDMAAATESAYSLGLGEPTFVSAATGKGVGDLLEEIFRKLDDMGKPPAEISKIKKDDGGVEFSDAPVVHGRNTSRKDGPHALRLVLMGRPNVGKSSIVNSILGEERVIVSPIAHTTREPQDTPFTYKGTDMVLVDTAGMRARSRITRGSLEEEGLERNRHALENADIAFLVFDASEDPRSQDKALAGLMESADKGLVLVANKWDLIPDKKTGSTNDYEARVRYMFPFLAWAPVVFISAKENLRTKNLLDVALAVQAERNRTIDYNALNRFLKGILKQKRAMASYGPKSPYIHDLAQVGVEPPTFLITIRGDKTTVHASWLAFLKKRLRDKFGFQGTPIIVKASNIPISKSERERNVRGPGMEAVTGGKVKEAWMTSKKKNVRWRP